MREQCERTLATTDFAGLGTRIEGKVRDSYVAGKRRFIVVTDRVSCFDRVVGSLPFKGQVLNQIAAFWFERTRAIAPNHLLEVPDPNVSIVRECRPLPVEFVVSRLPHRLDLDLDLDGLCARRARLLRAPPAGSVCAATRRFRSRSSRRRRRRRTASTTS